MQHSPQNVLTLSPREPKLDKQEQILQVMSAACHSGTQGLVQAWNDGSPVILQPFI